MNVFLKTLSVMESSTVATPGMNMTVTVNMVTILISLCPCVDQPIFSTVPGAPFYPPPTECPTSSDLLGACDVSECLVDAECGSEEMCCLNNCNERSCTLPVASIPACRATVQRLGANVSYIPQCSATGNFQPVQCMTGGEGEVLLVCQCTLRSSFLRYLQQ